MVGASSWWLVAFLSIVLVVGLWVFAAFSRFARPTVRRAVLNLDWYLPVVRKAKNGRVDTLAVWRRAAGVLLPRGWFSDRNTKKRGLVRKFLRRLGVSWQAAPVRRLIQGVCLAAFFILFLFVCWPYDARPQKDGWVSNNWMLLEVQQDTGLVVLSPGVLTQTVSEDQLGRSIFLQAESDRSSDVQVYETELREAAEDRIVVEPLVGSGDELLTRLLTEATNWKLMQRDPTAWPSHYADNLEGKELMPAEFFLAIDPLVSLSTAIASRSLIWSLVSAGGILLVCVLIPRGFCGYVCPLGTTIDLFDWAIGRRTERFRVSGEGGWWVHIKYYLLAGTLICSLMGVLVSGFFSAIPVITRASLLILDPFQLGLARGWHLVPAMNAGHFASIALFLVVLGLGFLRPRFWCKYVCPSGAVFSVANLFRVSERKVESSCIHCNKCVEICPFDAIKPDFTTRETDCTLCQSCAGVCPTHAIKFVERGNAVELKVLNEPPTNETAIGRRGFFSLAAGSAAAVVGGVGTAAATKSLGASESEPLVRPPGSVPEQEFLEMCIRCGECFKVCPNNVLQLQGFADGLSGLWTPYANTDWAGCESSCNACGQVCPTGAIRALPMEEKRVARMGLAVLNEQTCLPMAGIEDCDLCVQECISAGYDAIEYQQVGTEVDGSGNPIEGTGFLAPVVLDDLCVGCGLCQTRCHGINVKQKHVLSASAIVVQAGEGNEDRLVSGSYLSLRKQERVRISSQDSTVIDRPDGSEEDLPTQNESPSPERKKEEEPDFGDNPFGL